MKIVQDFRAARRLDARRAKKVFMCNGDAEQWSRGTRGTSLIRCACLRYCAVRADGNEAFNTSLCAAI